MKIQKCLIYSVLVCYCLLFTNSVSGAPDTAATWEVQPGTRITLHLDTYTNSSVDTKIDEIAQIYQFDSLDENFFGEPQIELNITAIDTEITTANLVSGLLNFTPPISTDQNLDGSWHKITLYNLPLCVPVGLWEEIQSEFQSQVPSSFGYTNTDEVWYHVIYSDAGQTVDVTYFWGDEDGLLQAIFYEVGMGDTKDMLVLRLAGINTPGGISQYALFLAIALGGVLVAGVVLLVVKIRSKKRMIGANNFGQRENLGHDKGKERGDPPSMEHDSAFLEAFGRFKRRYLIRWVILNALSVGIFVSGAYFVKTLGNSQEAENAIATVIWGGGLVLFIDTMLLNIPIFKLNKALAGHNIPQPGPGFRISWFKPKNRITRKQLIDPSPILSLAACMMGFLLYAILIDLGDITTIGGKLVMIFLCLLMVGVLGITYTMFPFRLLKDVKKWAFTCNYNFP